MRQPFTDFDDLTPDFSSHIQQDFSPADIQTSYIPVAPDFSSHIQQDFSPADIQTSYIPVAPDFSSHIQQDFSPADIQTSYIPVAPGFNPGGDRYPKNIFGLQPNIFVPGSPPAQNFPIYFTSANTPSNFTASWPFSPTTA
jgi:hypothetical protein